MSTPKGKVGLHPDRHKVLNVCALNAMGGRIASKIVPVKMKLDEIRGSCSKHADI